jgi:hypothetical protein
VPPPPHPLPSSPLLTCFGCGVERRRTKLQKVWLQQPGDLEGGQKVLGRHEARAGRVGATAALRASQPRGHRVGSSSAATAAAAAAAAAPRRAAVAAAAPAGVAARAPPACRREARRGGPGVVHGARREVGAQHLQQRVEVAGAQEQARRAAAVATAAAAAIAVAAARPARSGERGRRHQRAQRASQRGKECEAVVPGGCGDGGWVAGGSAWRLGQQAGLGGRTARRAPRGTSTPRNKQPLTCDVGVVAARDMAPRGGARQVGRQEGGLEGGRAAAAAGRAGVGVGGRSLRRCDARGFRTGCVMPPPPRRRPRRGRPRLHAAAAIDQRRARRDEAAAGAAGSGSKRSRAARAPQLTAAAAPPRRASRRHRRPRRAPYVAPALPRIDSRERPQAGREREGSHGNPRRRPDHCE